ncbi:MAG: hypothetical protein ACM3ZQ_11855 [Bacillota bacterium]
MDKWCSCRDGKCNDFVAAFDHYSRNFIPNGWALCYGTTQDLEQERYLYVTGSCRICGGRMRSGVELKNHKKDSDLLHEIWDLLNSYRPFPSGVVERSAWYDEQEQIPKDEKLRLFLSLFRPEDIDTVESWLELQPFAKALIPQG